MSHPETSMGGGRGTFLTTRWSLLEHGDVGDVVHIYWRPVYLYLRRKGHRVEDAKDLTQEFFATFLERDYAQQADRSRGKFRSFLRSAVDHFASDMRDKARAQKRGAGRVISLDVQAAEQILSTEDAPELQFDRQWAQSILDDAMKVLEQEYVARGHREKFKELRPVLAGGTSEDRVALHRARKRFRELVRERIARTVDGEGHVDEELAALFGTL